MVTDLYILKRKLDQASLWTRKAPLLSRLDMELTERCNNNCIHCCINLPVDDLEAKNRELSIDQVKGILKESVVLGCLRIRFTGGEPLLRADFEELYIFARKLGLKVLVFTNATLINSHLAELFSCIPPLEKIEVTLYGMKRKSYEAVTRTPGSFESAWEGINLLLKYKIPFVVKGALLPQNKDEIEEFESWTSTIPWMDNPPSYSMFFELRRSCAAEKNKLIKSIRVLPEEGLDILKRREDRYLKEMQEFCGKFMGPSGDKLFACGAGLNSGCVDAYGILHPCMALGHPDTVYDLGKGSLKDALTNFFPKVREIKAINPEYLARCAQCFLKGLCEQCPARSWIEQGTLDTPVEYFCQVAHTQARFLGLIKENEKAWEVEDWQERIREFREEEVYGSKNKS